MQKLLHSKSILFALLLLAPAMAQAHPGHGDIGWNSGFAHPLMGLDHLLAMIAVGLWAVQSGGRAIWMAPLTFISVMLLGGAMGVAQFGLPYVEHGILASILVLGIMIACAVRLPVIAGSLVVGIFALFHGYAHGAEMPAGVNGMGYSAGFAVATLLLHAAGVGAGLLLRRASRLQWMRVAGAAIACVGTILFFQ